MNNSNSNSNSNNNSHTPLVGGRFGRAKMGRGIKHWIKQKKQQNCFLTSQVRCADLPPAGRTIQKNNCFAFFANSQKSIQTKSTNFKKSIHQTVFCEKRQMGNVLLIVNIVIRIFLVEAATQLGQFDWKQTN